MFGFNLKRFIEGEEAGGKSHEDAVGLANRKLKGLLEGKHVKLSDISLKEMALAFCGYKWVDKLNPLMEGHEGIHALEATDAVDVTAFSQITGQIVYTAVHQGYTQEPFIGMQLVTEIPTNLQSEKIPGMEDISDEAMDVEEAMPYPYVGFGESFQQTPLTRKRGLAIGLTREAIFFDRTGIFVRQAMKIGERIMTKKEKEILDVVVGAVNNYNWRNLALSTYLTAPLTPGLWVNTLAGNPLTSWKSLDASKQVFQAIRNPETQDPIMVSGNQVLVTPFKEFSAKRILNATEVREDTGAATKEYSPSPVPAGMTVFSSQMLLDRIIAGVEPVAANAAEYWWHGDFKKAFAWMRNWPLTVVQAPVNSEAEFERDIVMRWRASERGKAIVYDPRYVVRNKSV